MTNSTFSASDSLANPPTVVLPYIIDLSVGISTQHHWLITLILFHGLNILRGWILTKSSEEKWTLSNFLGASIVAEIAHTVVNWNLKHQKHGAASEASVESVLSDYATGAIISLGVQAYFALRIYNAGLVHRFVPIAMALAAVAALLASLYSNNYRVEPQYPALSWVTDATFTNGMLAHVLFLMVSEVTMVASLAWSLGRPDDYGVKKTTPMLEKLLHYAVARGGMVALAHLYVLTQYFAHPHLLIWVPLLGCQSTIYAYMTIIILTSRSNFKSLDLLELSDRIRADRLGSRNTHQQAGNGVGGNDNSSTSSNPEAKGDETPNRSEDSKKGTARPEENV